MKIMVKVSDISNEARPMAVAEPWLDRLLQEFFHQVLALSLRTGTQEVTGEKKLLREVHLTVELYSFTSYERLSN